MPLPNFLPNLQEGGQLVTALQGQNALTKTSLENQIAGAQAKYAPYQAYGNAYLTNQQAQWLPYQYQMQAMSNPLLWMAAQNNPTLMNQLKQMIGNPSLPNGQGGINIPLPNQQGNSNPLAQILSLFTGNKGGSPNAMGNPPQMQQGQPTGGQNPDQMTNRQVVDYANSHQGANGYPITPTQQQTTQAAPQTFGAQTPAAIAAGNVAGQAGLTGPTSLAAAEGTQQAAKEAITGQQQAQTEQQKERSKLISSQAIIAKNALDYLNGFSRNYDKAKYKGQFVGEHAEQIPTLPGSNVSPEQLANRYANQLVTSLSGLKDTPAGSTDMGRELIAGGKPDLSLDDDAKKEMIETYSAKLHRMVTLRNFANDFIKNNPNATEEQLVAMMNAYNTYAPPYDFVEGKPLPQNDKNFKDFTSPAALQSYIQNGDYNPYENKKTEQKETKPTYKQPVGEILETKMIDGKKYARFKEGWHKVLK